MVKRGELGGHLSALFDLCVNGIYARALFTDEGQLAQGALGCGQSSVFLPFVWMCPACVAAGLPLQDCYLPGARREDGRDYPVQEQLAKPGGRAIGDAGIKVLLAILRATLRVTRPTAVLREGGGAHGEFDLTISDQDFLLFGEVKAKPLIAHPIRLNLPTGLSPGSHAWVRPNLSALTKPDLFIAISGTTLPLSPPSDDPTWPLSDLGRALSMPNNLLAVLTSWRRHLEGYRKWDGEDRSTRWHRFGCGNFSVGAGAGRIEKRVANTKELPGLDRTDDIKKGAAQILKFSRFKFDCEESALRTVLLGNTYAETHAADYIDPLLRLRVTRGDDGESSSEWIFDAVVGLTVNQFNAPELRDLFDFERLLQQH